MNVCLRNYKNFIISWLKCPAFPVELKKIKKFWTFSAYVTPGIALGSIKKCQPIRSSRLAGYMKQIYDGLVLLYRFND